MGERTSCAPRTFSWADLARSEAAAAKGFHAAVFGWGDPRRGAGERGAPRFYGAPFGWTLEEIPGPGGYRVIRNGERTNGGVMPLDPARMGAEVPPAWMPDFGHEDVDRLVREIGHLGGRFPSGPLRMPQGSIAVLADPQGAVFAVWTGEYED